MEYKVVKVEKEIQSKLKILAINKEITFQDLVNQILKEYLRKEEK